MNKLKDFGFSANWWRGKKGEYWVLAQTLISIGFLLLPVYPGITQGNLSAIVQYSRWGIIGLCGSFAVLLLLGGGLALGGNLTPLPYPKEEGTLVTTGTYRLVRHPLYSGVILAAIAYSAWQWSLTQAIASIIFFIFFDLKAHQEEEWLKQKFSDYHQCQTEVKKLLPWLY
jgi:protein-S-isoprenylcysteine O-methyltransferase Ste14